MSSSNLDAISLPPAPPRRTSISQINPDLDEQQLQNNIGEIAANLSISADANSAYYLCLAASRGDLCSLVCYSIYLAQGHDPDHVQQGKIYMESITRNIQTVKFVNNKQFKLMVQDIVVYLSEPVVEPEFYASLAELFTLIVGHDLENGNLAESLLQDEEGLMHISERLILNYSAFPTNEIPVGMFMSAYSYFFDASISAQPDNRIALKSILLLLTIYNQPLSPLLEISLSKLSKLLHTKNQTIPIYENLIDKLTKTIDLDKLGILVLHFLLTNIQEFKMYLLSKSDCQDLFLGLLKNINGILKSKSDTEILYAAMDILIVVGQDQVFSSNLFKLLIPTPTWMSATNNNKSTTIASVVYLSLLQLMKTNMVEFKDLYIHASTCATINNFSTSVSTMDLLFCARVSNLLEYSAKKLAVFQSSTISESATIISPDDTKNQIDASSSNNSILSQQDAHDHELQLQILQDCIAVLLRFIAQVLTVKDLNLIYILLDKIPVISSLETPRTIKSTQTILKVNYAYR